MSIVFVVLAGLLVLSGLCALIALIAATSGFGRNTTGFIFAALGMLCIYYNFPTLPYVAATLSFLFVGLPLMLTRHHFDYE